MVRIMSEETKIVFISGASRGIGAGIALRLAQSGYDIWLNYRSSDKEAEQIKGQIEEYGQQCTLLKLFNQPIYG